MTREQLARANEINERIKEAEKNAKTAAALKGDIPLGARLSLIPVPEGIYETIRAMVETYWRDAIVKLEEELEQL